MPEIQYRAATPSDVPALSQLFQDVYGRVRSPEHYAWKFFAPLPDYDGDRVWVAEAEGHLVGSIAIMPFTMWIEGQLQPGAAMVEGHVRKDYRRQGLLTRLHELLVDGLAKNGARCSMCMPNEVSINFLRSVGYEELFPAIWLRRSVSWVEGFLTPRHLPCTIREIETPGAECEQLWQRLSATLDCCAIPSPARLAYRFRQCPDKDYHFLLAEDSAGPCGLLVVGWRWFGKHREAVVANRYTAPGDVSTLRALSGAAARLARRQGYRGLRTIESSGAAVGTWEQAGFRRVTGEFLAHVLSVSPPIIPPSMRSPETFSVQLGDHDFV